MYRTKQSRPRPDWAINPVSLDQLATLVKNNVVFDLNECAAQIWLVCPDERVKNTFASTKLIVVEAIAHTLKPR